jgi:3-methylcrotonyl-CoA carboxylase alpha subunit
MAGGTRTISYTYQALDYKLTVRPACDKVEAWDIQLHTQTDLIRSEVSEVVVHGNLLLLRRGNSQERVYVQRETQATLIVSRGKQYRLQRRIPPDIQTSAREHSTTQTQKMLNAPMAGTIVKVQTHEGENVEAHQVLIVVSAMKMEHAITAPYAGTVRHVFYQEGAVVQGGSALIEMQ